MARDRKFSIEELFQQAKKLLLLQGYEGFTFSLLAQQLDVSRGTLYKYYDNKDELITDFMLHEMNLFLNKLKEINDYNTFDEKFDFLIDLILQNKDIQPFISMNHQIQSNSNEKVKHNKEQLSKLHLDMYVYLQDFINLGKRDGKLKVDLPFGLILGFIFQTIAIPNHYDIPSSEWNQSIREIICHGMFNHH